MLGISQSVRVTLGLIFIRFNSKGSVICEIENVELWALYKLLYFVVCKAEVWMYYGFGMNFSLYVSSTFLDHLNFTLELDSHEAVKSFRDYLVPIP